jgi:YidC/Oxa1 family membrane protein insertase
MDRRFFLALILCMGVLFVWERTVLQPFQQRQLDAQQQTEDPDLESSPTALAGDDDDSASAFAELPTPAPELPEAPASEYGFESQYFQARVSNRQGALTEALVHGYNESVANGWIGGWWFKKLRGKDAGVRPGSCVTGEPVDLVNDPQRANLLFAVDDATGRESARNLTVRDGPEGGVSYLRREGSVEIETQWLPPDEAGAIPLRFVVRNLGNSSLTLQPRLRVADTISEQGRSLYANAPELVARVDGKVKTLPQPKIKKKGRVERPGTTDLIGIGDRYFLMAFIPERPGVEARAVAEGEDRYAQILLWSETSFAPGQEQTFGGLLFLGPKNAQILAQVDQRLRQTVSYGFFAVLSWPILAVLQFFHGLVGSWGLAIILLTLIIKLLLLPLSQKSYESMEAMKRLQPEIDALRDKHKSDPMALNQATMALWKKHGVNPMGGCLPMFIQLPIWFALYRVLWVSIDLYQQPFLYFCDLTERDPYALTPALLMVTMVVQMRFQPTPSDPTQAMVMKFMPIFFGVIMFQLPAGLVVYILINTLLSIGQQYYIKRRMATKLSK